ncbi:MAG: retroviral-like aspartic protease family protein [Planctomycetota bacterium]
MGTFSTAARVADIADRDREISVPQMLVDTGSEYTWVTASLLEQIGVEREKKDRHFVMANGEEITRPVGFAVLHVAGTFTVDEVVFAEPADFLLLGARTLEGLNLVVDAAQKKLVAAGPLPVA